jgi:hypothetical protein
MAFTRAWRNFKRMQDLTVAAASLIYAAAVVHALAVLPGGAALALRWTLFWPALWLAGSFLIPMFTPVLKRWLARWVWMSFQAGFGQTPGSILTGVALLLGTGLFIYWQVGRVAATGTVGANVFSAYAAGIGILAAQAVLVRALEQLPDVRARIEEKGL